MFQRIDCPETTLLSADSPQVLHAVAVRILVIMTRDVLVAASHFAAADALDLEQAVLLRLPERPWSPFTSIPCSDIQTVCGRMPQSVGIVRDSFSTHSVSQRPLSELLKATSPGQVAAHSGLAQPHLRALVDRYDLNSSGSYNLHASSIDLLRYLHQHGVRVALHPDLASQVRPSSNAQQSTNEVRIPCLHHFFS